MTGDVRECLTTRMILSAADYFKEEAEAAVLGMKTPEKAMADLANRVRPLLG